MTIRHWLVTADQEIVRLSDVMTVRVHELEVETDTEPSAYDDPRLAPLYASPNPPEGMETHAPFTHACMAVFYTEDRDPVVLSYHRSIESANDEIGRWADCFNNIS